MTHSEIQESLQCLKGINVDKCYLVAKENKLNVRRSGFSENLVAILLNKSLPKNFQGMDFKGLFEVKEMQVKITRKGEMRPEGDTMISSFALESNFYTSNIWDKTKRILLVCVVKDSLTGEKTIVDIRLFNGEKYKDQLAADYKSICDIKNHLRKNNTFLCIKIKRNSIAFKGNVGFNLIDLSESVLFDEDNKIEDQDQYIRNLFEEKFATCNDKDRNLSDYEMACFFINRLNVFDLGKLSEYVNNRNNDCSSFDLNAGCELNF